MERKFNTRAVHGGEYTDRAIGNVTTPIYETSTFLNPNPYPDAALDHTRNKPFMYTRWGNPTLEVLEIKYRELDDVQEALSFSSGMAAITSTVLSLVKSGDRLLSLKELYGETFTFFTKFLPMYGIKVDFVSLDELNSGTIPVKGYSGIYTESIVNPTLGISDLITIGRVAKEENIPMITDATFASPYNQNPSSLNASITIHSGTKYIGGHSDILLGLAGFKKDLMDQIWSKRKMFGSVPDPIQAFLAIRGLKTLGVRMRAHNENGHQIAKFLSEHKKIDKVHYAGLETSKYYEIGKRNLKGFGGMVSFELNGGVEEARRMAKKLKLFAYAPSLGGVESLLTLPAETSHLSLTEKERQEAGIAEGLVRMSIGIEDADDLIEDLKNALD